VTPEIERLESDEVEPGLLRALERPFAGAPDSWMHPEPQLVDETGRQQVARQLTAADQDQVAVELLLQPGHALCELALDHAGVPVERPLQRP
jgi:hypothetical protein